MAPVDGGSLAIGVQGDAGGWNTHISAPAHAPKILRWVAQTDAEEYLRALKIRTKGLRNQAQKFLFKDCKVEDKDLLPWPII